jgi:DNA-binding transcriptional LysR family regulator
VPPDFAPALAPALAVFLRQHPKIRVELSASARAAELVGEHADLGLAHGRLPDSSLISRRLGETAHRLYAAPSYLAARGQPSALDELARHSLILRNGSSQWEMIGPRGVEIVQVAGVVSGDHLWFIVDTTLAGLGIALLPEFAVAAHQRAGALVEVLPAYHAAIQLQLLTHASRRVPYRVALLRDFLATHLSGQCAEHGGKPLCTKAEEEARATQAATMR